LDDEPEAESPAPSPLEFALHVMQDEAQPMALRVSAAKLAASLLPNPAQETPKETSLPPDEAPERDAQRRMPEGCGNPQGRRAMVRLELARRIAHIMLLADAELDAQEGGKPVEKDETTRLLERAAGKTQ
jgi:hypothetical protein